MKHIEQELELIKEEIAKSFEDGIFLNELRSFVLMGSKFIRSALAILYLKVNNKELNADIASIIASCEIIHNASLLHDDVIDDAKKRRGKKTFAARFSSKVSILAGDYLLSKAIAKLAGLNKNDVLADFQECAEKMVEAEIQQYFLRGNLPTEAEYIEICRQKTAMLFATTLKACAKQANLKEDDAYKFGELFGLCFQLKNDLEPLSANVDIKNGIYTAKDIFGIEKTALLLDNYKEQMRNLLKEFPHSIYKEGLEDLVNKL